MHTESEYRVSERVLLRRGDVFRARGGPFFQKGRERVSLAAPGPYKFVEAHVHGGGRVSILAIDRNGHHCEMRVAGTHWRRIDPSVVPRLYVITGRKRNAKTKSDPQRRLFVEGGGDATGVATVGPQSGGDPAAGGEKVHVGRRLVSKGQPRAARKAVPRKSR